MAAVLPDDVVSGDAGANLLRRLVGDLRLCATGDLVEIDVGVTIAVVRPDNVVPGDVRASLIRSVGRDLRRAPAAGEHKERGNQKERAPTEETCSRA